MAITPSPLNLRIGAGNVLFGEWVLDDNDEWILHGRHMGNVESVVLNNEVTKLDKFSSMEGARGLYASFITRTAATVTLILSELDVENIGLAFLSTPKAFTQTYVAAVAKEINNGVAVELDHWYDLGGFNADVDSVSQGGVLDPEDYEVNAPGGLIRILSSGAGTAAITTWTGTLPGLSGQQVSGLDTPTRTGAIRVVDAVDQVTGIRGVLDIYNASIQPSSDIQLIQEEFATLTLQGSILADTRRPAGDRYYRWVPLSELTDVGS